MSFDPIEIKNLEAELEVLVNMSSFDSNNHDKEYIFETYFKYSKGQDSIENYIARIDEIVVEITPLLTHPNKDIQTIFYRSHTKLRQLRQKAEELFPVFKEEKEKAVEAFNNYFQGTLCNE